MELLREDQLMPEPGERVFRHGRLGPFAAWCLVAAPLAAAVALRAEVLAAARAVPWYGWLGAGPLLALVGFLYLVCVQAVAQVAYRALLPSAWLLRISPAGLVLKLRSYQNAHFPAGDASVARFAWDELASARRVREWIETADPQAPVRRTWLELELRTADTAELERAVQRERERPAPETSFLGIKSRTRFGHVPVFVARPGVVRVDWLGGAVLRALGRHLTLAAPRRDDLTGGGAGAHELDARLRALCARGERLAAWPWRGASAASRWWRRVRTSSA